MFIDGISSKNEASEMSGRGVGLASLKSACHDLGGKIEVESEKGKGTSMKFLFPVGKSLFGAA